MKKGIDDMMNVSDIFVTKSDTDIVENSGMNGNSKRLIFRNIDRVINNCQGLTNNTLWIT